MTKKPSKDIIKVSTKRGSIRATGKAALILASGLAIAFIIIAFLYFR